MRQRSILRVRWSAVLVALTFIASACGAGSETLAVPTADGSESNQALDEFLASEAAKTPTSFTSADEFNPTGDSPAGEHNFGASLDEFASSQTDSELPASEPPPEGFSEIQWEDLVPTGFSEEDISARFDERIAEVEPGSPEADAVFAELQAEFDNQPVNPDLDGDEIMLAGFVAPLTYVDDLITEFLLVPYFGACIHVPPPPANQTVMVALDGDGLTIPESYGAVWVTGTLTLDGETTELAQAGYTIRGAQTGVHELQY